MRFVVPFAIVLLGCPSEPDNDETIAQRETPTSGDERPLEEQLPVEALRAEDAIGFAQMSREDDDCMPAEEIGIDPEAWRISETRTLVWLPCQRGAYQVVGALFLVGDDGETEPVALPYAHPSGDMLSEMSTGDFTFDASTRVAVDRIRYRGLGDCGRLLRYQVGNVGLTLIEHREKACEDEPSEGGPDTWPVVYPRPE